MSPYIAVHAFIVTDILLNTGLYFSKSFFKFQNFKKYIMFLPCSERVFWVGEFRPPHYGITEINDM
jgi:hypothetical protein